LRVPGDFASCLNEGREPDHLKSDRYDNEEQLDQREAGRAAHCPDRLCKKSQIASSLRFVNESPRHYPGMTTQSNLPSNDRSFVDTSTRLLLPMLRQVALSEKRGCLAAPCSTSP
jgi:hypothetical protein